MKPFKAKEKISDNKITSSLNISIFKEPTTWLSWWKSEKWEIISSGYLICEEFTRNIARFQSVNNLYWLINTKWEILIKDCKDIVLPKSINNEIYNPKKLNIEVKTIKHDKVIDYIDYSIKMMNEDCEEISEELKKISESIWKKDKNNNNIIKLYSSILSYTENNNKYKNFYIYSGNNELLYTEKIEDLNNRKIEFVFKNYGELIYINNQKGQIWKIIRKDWKVVLKNWALWIEDFNWRLKKIYTFNGEKASHIYIHKDGDIYPSNIYKWNNILNFDFIKDIIEKWDTYKYQNEYNNNIFGDKYINLISLWKDVYASMDTFIIQFKENGVNIEKLKEYHKNYLLNRHKLLPDVYKEPISQREFVEECNHDNNLIIS